MSTADPVVDEYARAAERYDEKWAFYLETTTRETLRRLPMTPMDEAGEAKLRQTLVTYGLL